MQDVKLGVATRAKRMPSGVRFITLILFGAALILQGCSGSGTSNGPGESHGFTLSGSIAGLADGGVVVLKNGSDTVEARSNGTFSFASPVPSNGSYSVTVETQPQSQACTVFNGSGSAVSANVSNVTVVCLNRSHNLAGRVSGLASGAEVVLANNGFDVVTISDNGTFYFSPVAANASYSITVERQPAGQICTVSNGSGAGVIADVSNVRVACSTQTYTLSGSVSGLLVGAQLTLENNDADPMTISSNGAFTFPTATAHNGSYRVVVTEQPSGATCTVTNPSGSGVTADVGDIVIVCSTNSYPISGTVAGLAVGSQVTLNNNGADALTLTANGMFSFATPVAFQGAYNVTVATQPNGQTCSVINSNGTNVSTNISNVVVACAASTYSIGGAVSGLTSGAQVTLLNNGSDPLTLTANGTFTFATPVVHNGGYNVRVGTQPNGMRCAIANGVGAALTNDISSVSIACSATTTPFDAPGTYSWTVPAGVTSIQIIATGGGGGGGGNSGIPQTVYAGGAGGAGAVVTSTLAVVEGQQFILTVGGGGGGGANSSGCGTGGGGGGSTNVDIGTTRLIIAGGGGGGSGCWFSSKGGDGGGPNGAGGTGGTVLNGAACGGEGGRDGIGGAGGLVACLIDAGSSRGGDGVGGMGGSGGFGIPDGNAGGGMAGWSQGNGVGGTQRGYGSAGGGGGGYGGGGSGTSESGSSTTGGLATGGGGGGSLGPAGTTYAVGSNGGAASTSGGHGSIVITHQ